MTRVAAEVKGANKGPEPSDGLVPFLGQDSGNGQSSVLAKFVGSLSEALGGFELPDDLLETHATVIMHQTSLNPHHNDPQIVIRVSRIFEFASDA